MKELEFHKPALEFHSKTPRFLGVQILKIFKKKLEIGKPWDNSPDENLLLFLKFVEFGELGLDLFCLAMMSAVTPPIIFIHLFIYLHMWLKTSTKIIS